MDTREKTEQLPDGFDLRYKLQESDMIDLWKYFEEQGNTVKARMLNIVTLLLALATGLLGFTFKELKFLEGIADRAWVGMALSVLGLAICVYAGFLILEYGNHMRRHWKSADWLLERIEGLETIKLGRRSAAKDFEDKLPEVCKQVLWIVIVIGVLFAIIMLYSLPSFLRTTF